MVVANRMNGSELHHLRTAQYFNYPHHRLSKSGEESKLTRIYTGDVIRFGSDVVDKVQS